MTDFTSGDRVQAIRNRVVTGTVVKNNNGLIEVDVDSGGPHRHFALSDLRKPAVPTQGFPDAS